MMSMSCLKDKIVVKGDEIKLEMFNLFPKSVSWDIILQDLSHYVVPSDDMDDSDLSPEVVSRVVKLMSSLGDDSGFALSDMSATESKNWLKRHGSGYRRLFGILYSLETLRGFIRGKTVMISDTIEQSIHCLAVPNIIELLKSEYPGTQFVACTFMEGGEWAWLSEYLRVPEK